MKTLLYKMITRLYFIVGIFILLGMVVLTSFYIFNMATKPCCEYLFCDSEHDLRDAVDRGSEEAIRKYYGPMISGFLGLNFPGQYASYDHGENPRSEYYFLSEDEREIAIKKLQDTFRETKKVVVIFHELSYADKGDYYEEHLLVYNTELVGELCNQTALIGELCISPLMCLRSHPDITFTFHPSKLKLCFRGADWLYASFGEVEQQQCSGLGIPILSDLLLDSRLQNGTTVRSVRERINGCPYVRSYPVQSETIERQ